jgi:hypothetical protein
MLVSGRGIVFASQEDIRIDFDDIEAVDHTHNGIAITARNPARRLYFEGADRTVVLLKVQDRAYDEPLSGRVLRLTTEAIMKISLENRG